MERRRTERELLNRLVEGIEFQGSRERFLKKRADGYVYVFFGLNIAEQKGRLESWVDVTNKLEKGKSLL